VISKCENCDDLRIIQVIKPNDKLTFQECSACRGERMPMKTKIKTLYSPNELDESLYEREYRDYYARFNRSLA
jgi:hypothetical protein